MNKKEVQERLWKDFTKFMNGQTVGITEEGKIDYYENDVNRYMRY